MARKDKGRVLRVDCSLIRPPNMAFNLFSFVFILFYIIREAVVMMMMMLMVVVMMKKICL